MPKKKKKIASRAERIKRVQENFAKLDKKAKKRFAGTRTKEVAKSGVGGARKRERSAVRKALGG